MKLLRVETLLGCIDTFVILKCYDFMNLFTSDGLFEIQHGTLVHLEIGILLCVSDRRHLHQIYHFSLLRKKQNISFNMKKFCIYYICDYSNKASIYKFLPILISQINNKGNKQNCGDINDASQIFPQEILVSLVREVK